MFIQRDCNDFNSTNNYKLEKKMVDHLHVVLLPYNMGLCNTRLLCIVHILQFILLTHLDIYNHSDNYSFAVIQHDTQHSYKWSKSTIQLLTLWSPICFIPTALLLSYCPKNFSSRSYITVASALVCFASIFKAITRSKPYALIFAHTAQILNGIAGPFVLSTPSLISSEWFPINQRIFATSIAISANYLGI